MSGRALIRRFQSRSFAGLLILIALVFGFAIIGRGTFSPAHSIQGLVFTTSQPWISNPYVSFIINFLFLTTVALVPVFLNRRFKIFRSSTWLYVGLFFMMELCFPWNFLNYCPATVYALFICVTLTLLFSILSDIKATRTVFLMAFFLGTTSLWIASAFYLLPAVMLCVWQMRALNLKTGIAFILGIITPFWIVWGFDIASPSDICFPVSGTDFIDVIRSMSKSGLPAFLLIMILAFGFSIAALIKILNYNYMRKAYNGVLVTILVFIMILVFADSSNTPVYMTSLCLLSALEIAHVLSVVSSEKVWIWMIVFPVLFFLLAFGNIL